MEQTEKVNLNGKVTKSKFSNIFIGLHYCTDLNLFHFFPSDTTSGQRYKLLKILWIQEYHKCTSTVTTSHDPIKKCTQTCRKYTTTSTTAKTRQFLQSHKVIDRNMLPKLEYDGNIKMFKPSSIII